jgi:hypothetical protein
VWGHGVSERSKIAATSSGRAASGARRSSWEGDVLGERAGPLDAEPIEGRTEWRRPAMQLRQRPQRRGPRRSHARRARSPVTFEPTSTTSPHELVADHERDRDRPLRPAVQRWMWTSVPQIPVSRRGSDVVDPDLRLGHVLEPEARLGAALDERLHGAGWRLEVPRRRILRRRPPPGTQRRLTPSRSTPAPPEGRRAARSAPPRARP